LPPRDDAILPVRKQSKSLLGRTRVTFSTHTVG
jgi:hypothetical protein